MNLFEFFGVLVLGSLFNIFILVLATGLISKQVGGQVKQIIVMLQKVVESVKGGLKDGE